MSQPKLSAKVKFTIGEPGPDALHVECGQDARIRLERGNGNVLHLTDKELALLQRLRFEDLPHRDWKINTRGQVEYDPTPRTSSPKEN